MGHNPTWWRASLGSPSALVAGWVLTAVFKEGGLNLVLLGPTRQYEEGQGWVEAREMDGG